MAGKPVSIAFAFKAQLDAFSFASASITQFIMMQILVYLVSPPSVPNSSAVCALFSPGRNKKEIRSVQSERTHFFLRVKERTLVISFGEFQLCTENCLSLYREFSL
jgi:hypothetical protein